MGVRKQHVKSADTLHVWIWYPPHAQAYSQTTAADFFVFWTRCQWLIKHTAYHLNTALTLFLFLIFKSPRTSILSNCWPRKKESSIGHTLASSAPRLPSRGRPTLARACPHNGPEGCLLHRPWQGGRGRGTSRPPAQRVMGWGRRSPKKLKIYFCSGSNEIIWYPLEGSIRTKTEHSRGGAPWR